MRILKRKIKSNKALSEVLGTILLLGISVSLFSVIYASLFSIQATPSPPSVNIVGTIEENILILDHMGGEDLALNTKIKLSFPENPSKESKTLQASDDNYLTDQAKQDDKWNIGERFSYCLDGESGFSRFQSVNVLVIDEASNSIIMSGLLKEAKKADLELKGDISSQSLNIGDKPTLSLVLRNNGPCETEDVKINIEIPEGLETIDYDAEGSYNPSTGIWEIPAINPGEKKLNIEFKVVGTYETEFTQLVFIIDGSENCSLNQWNNIISALQYAVLNTIPHPNPGKVELTIIQYGTASGFGPSYAEYNTARLEVGPIILKSSNVANIATQIGSIQKMGGHCPMDAGLLKAQDVLSASQNFDTDHKQIFGLFVSGLPDCYVLPEDEPYYRATRPKDDKTAHYWGKLAAGLRRDKVISNLLMTADQDEINCILNLNPWGYSNEPIPWDDFANISWLANDIAWPGSFYYEYGGQWPPDGPGWVRGVLNDAQINDCIQEMLSISTTSSKIVAEVTETKYMDPFTDNNRFEIIIEIT